MNTQIPKAEVSINRALIKSLLKSQFPRLANLELNYLGAGWDNENYRLGKDLIVRLPRRTQAVKTWSNEVTWLNKMKDKLPISVPAPIYIGSPSKSYPWQWSIIPWTEGVTANKQYPRESEAIRVIHFLKALHIEEPENPPINPHRGIPLKEKEAATKKRLEGLKRKTNLISPKVARLWELALKEEIKEKPCLIHGDLHPKNIIVKNRKIEAIIDWGDITSGDVANDLAVLWMLFANEEVRQKALDLYGVDKSLILRSMGWALFLGILLLDAGWDSNSEYVEIGAFILKNLDGAVIPS